MLNPDEEGHAPPPAPLLGAFLDAPRRELRARDGLDPDVFGMAKLPPELQRRIKQQAGLKSLAFKEECQPTCVDDDSAVVWVYDCYGHLDQEWIWRDQQGYYSPYWERLDDWGLPLSHSHALAERLALPSVRKAGGARATRAKRGARRPRNESIVFCRLGAHLGPSWPIAPFRQPATDGKPAAYPSSWFHNRKSSSYPYLTRSSSSFYGGDARFSTRVPERVLYNGGRVFLGPRSSSNKRAEAKKRRVLCLAQQAACLAACLAIQRKAERAHRAAFQRAAKAVRHKINCAILRGSRSGGGGYGNLYEILA